MSANIASSPVTACVVVTLSTAAVIGHYEITAVSANDAPTAFTLEGSNDGSTWTLVDWNVGLSWLANEKKAFVPSTPASFLYYRIRVSATISGTMDIAALTLFPVAGQVCATASATSTISQADANQKAHDAALLIAQSQINCQQVYTSTQQFTAHCPAGQFGSDVTKSATATSLVSQQDADNKATAIAQVQAEAALVCNLSNNDQPITINDSPGAPWAGLATPYPSVEHIPASGVIAKVAVTLTGFSHAWPSDVHMVLVSPTGTKVCLMRGAGDSVAVSDLDLVFDQDAASALPSTGLSSGTFKPGVYGTVPYPFPPPGPGATYGSSLNDFIGEDKLGSWALWVIDILHGNAGSISGGWSLTIT